MIKFYFETQNKIFITTYVTSFKIKTSMPYVYLALSVCVKFKAFKVDFHKAVIDQVSQESFRCIIFQVLVKYVNNG